MLDLRDNPGGPLDQAIAVSNRFLRQGQPIVETRGRVPNSNEQYRANQRGGYTDVPLVVLDESGERQCVGDRDWGDAGSRPWTAGR